MRLRVDSSTSGSRRGIAVLVLILVPIVVLPVSIWLALRSSGADDAVSAKDPVSNCDDSGAGSLRHAVVDANSGEIITFASSLGCSTITLTSTITINRSLTIDGPGARVLTVSGSTTAEVFHVDPGVTATISGLTVKHGNAPYGGGIYNSGILTVTKSSVSDNNAATGGGGIWNDDRLTVEDSALSGNRSGYFGGGIYSGPRGTLLVIDSTLSGNSTVDIGIAYPEYAYGGGIYADGTASVTGSTFTDNTEQCIGGGGGGGGIYSGGTLTVSKSKLLDNSASIIYGDILDDGGGGILNVGTLKVVDSVLSGNTTNVDGGGIANGWRIDVTGSTLSNNSATTGANIYNGAASHVVADGR